MTLQTIFYINKLHTEESNPCNLFKAGSINNDLVTKQLTGFPGRPKKRVFFISPLLRLESIVANVVGFPGFIFNLPKWIVPNDSNIGLTRSASPILTPPDVTTISH